MFSTVPATVPVQVASFYSAAKTALDNPLISNRADINKTTVGKQGDSVTISSFAEIMRSKTVTV